MKKFMVLTDSTSDLEADVRSKYGIDYLKMVFTFDKQEFDASLDWENLSPSDYYNKMRAGNRSVTGLVKTSEFEEKFKKYLDMGLDILYVACSSKLSGSLNAGKIVAKELLTDYPERKIICFDSLRSNYSEGMIAIKAAELAEEMSIDECVKKLEEIRLNYQSYATVGSLEWLKKAGRVKASTAFFGNLFGVKPIILGDAIGNNYAYKKVKGRKASLDELVQTVRDRIDMDSDLYIEHADCLRDAEYIYEALKDKVKNIRISNLGPIIGATVGPDSLSVNFYGKTVEIVGEE